METGETVIGTFTDLSKAFVSMSLFFPKTYYAGDESCCSGFVISYMSGRYQVIKIEFPFKSNICLFNCQNY